jgi:hypothetical protein
MARTRSTIKDIIHSKLNQASLSISDSTFDNSMDAALDALLIEVDFPEAEKTSALTPIFDRVTSYSPPSDMRGDTILEVRPYPSGDKTQGINLERNQTWEFDRNYFWERNSGRYAIEYNAGVKTLRLFPEKDSAANYILHNCNTYDQNGTWAAVAGAGSIETDTGIFVEGSGSVRWTASANTTTIANSTMTAVDTSSVAVGKSVLFADIYLPITTVTSVTVRWGSDSSNYFEGTVTTNYSGSDWVVGWNTIGASYENATTVGSPDTSDIDYVYISLVGTAFSGEIFRVDNYALRDGDLFQIKYYTKNLVETAAGTKQQYMTDDDDFFIFNEEGEILYLDYLAGYIAPNVKDNTGQTWGQIAQNHIKRYLGRYPSKRKRTTRKYYKTYRPRDYYDRTTFS